MIAYRLMIPLMLADSVLFSSQQMVCDGMRYPSDGLNRSSIIPSSIALCIAIRFELSPSILFQEHRLMLVMVFLQRITALLWEGGAIEEDKVTF